MEGYEASTYGEGFADVYDEWYGDLGDVDAAVDLLAALAGDGRVLELGTGTGRLAVPLARRGVDVLGIDTSPTMLAKLADTATSGRRVGASRADMTCLPFVSGSMAVVFAACNTLFNLVAPGAVRLCLDEVVRVLRPGGRFVVETFVADYDDSPRRGVEVRSIDIDRVVLTASMLDARDQTIAGQHIEIRESGIRLRPWLLRYLDLDQLDALATSSGLDLAERRADWAGRPFTSDSDDHVSVYRTRDDEVSGPR